MSLATLERELVQMGAQITRDFRPALREVDHYLTQRIGQSFGRRVEPDGTPWAKRPSGEEATLVKSGDLRTAAVSKGPGAVADITTDHLERGVKIPYSPFMQYGVGKRRAKKRKKVKQHAPKPGSRGAKALANMKGPPKLRRRRIKKNFVGPRQMRVPARPYIGFTEQDADRIANIGADFLADRLVKR